jgi:hypothetical protein
MECKCCKELSQLLALMCIKYGESFFIDYKIPEDHGCPGTERNWGSYFSNIARLNT